MEHKILRLVLTAPFGDIENTVYSILLWDEKALDLNRAESSMNKLLSLKAKACYCYRGGVTNRVELVSTLLKNQTSE